MTQFHPAQQTHSEELPDELVWVAADLVLFARDERGKIASVLLIEGKYGWCLPGGKMKQGEEIEDTLRRETWQEIHYVTDTSIEVPGRYHRVGRDPHHSRRVISYPFMAILPAQIPFWVGSDAKRYDWWDIHSLPDLAYADHAVMIQRALELAEEKGSVKFP